MNARTAMLALILLGACAPQGPAITPGEPIPVETLPIPIIEPT